MQPGVRVLTGGDGVQYRFDPGSISLELLLTGGPGPYARFEILHQPADLIDWVPGSRLARQAPISVSDVRVTPADLRKIRHLRDTLWPTAAAFAGEAPMNLDDLEIINGYAEPPLRPRVAPQTMDIEWTAPITGRQLLGAFARDAIGLVRYLGRVRRCAASDCQLIFLDISRPGSRRWCSMERCGNRAKVRSFRSRDLGWAGSS